jgi:hypothetical protein
MFDNKESTDSSFISIFKTIKYDVLVLGLKSVCSKEELKKYGLP